jgi:hypothetical protein
MLTAKCLAHTATVLVSVSQGNAALAGESNTAEVLPGSPESDRKVAETAGAVPGEKKSADETASILASHGTEIVGTFFTGINLNGMPCVFGGRVFG